MNGKTAVKYQPITQTTLSALIADEIRTSIKVGKLSPGDRLPPVCEIAKGLGVSAPTVRKAITLLSADGELTACKQRGVLVTQVRDEREDTAKPLR